MGRTWIHTRKDGTSSIVELLENGNIVVDGLEIERPLTEAEARNEVARQALKRWETGEFRTLSEATRAVLNGSEELKRLYVDPVGPELYRRPR